MVPGTRDSERPARPNVGRRLLSLAGLVITVTGVIIFLVGVVNGDTAMWVWGLAYSLMGQAALLPDLRR